MPDPSDPNDMLPEPANLVFLRRLVTVLTATMIAGMVVIIALIWIRFNATPELLPESLSLPDGQRAMAVTRGSDWVAVVTDQDKIVLFDAITGQVRQTVDVLPRPAADASGD